MIKMKDKEEEKIIHIDGEEVYEHHKQIVDDNQITMRIDKFIVNQIANMTRNKIQKLADQGFVFVNDMPVKSSYKIKPKDVITIKKISDEIETVTLSGEIYFPGTYPIAKDETLFDLIDRAGGLTEYANTGNTVFSRKEIAQIQLKRFKQAQDELKRQILLSSNSDTADDKYLSRLSSLTEADVDLEGLGRLVFDYDAIKNGVADDIVLIDGDKIQIQKDKQTVSILGEVYAPNTVFFESELALDDYIKLSGGVTKYGSLDDAYIIRSNGTVYPIKDSNNASGGFFRGSRGFVQPGDTIVVPVEIVVDEKIRRISELSQIIYQLGFAAAAINNLN